MIIRPAKAEDHPQLRTLVMRFRESLADLEGRRAATTRADAEAELGEYEEKGFPLFVAEDEEGGLSGYLVCRLDGKTVWAESLFVEPSCRRRGIASQLYAEAERLAKNLGSRTVYNWVHPRNDAIVSFLKRRGYDVLNLIELRRPAPDEKLTRTINVGPHEFRH